MAFSEHPYPERLAFISFIHLGSRGVKGFAQGPSSGNLALLEFELTTSQIDLQCLKQWGTSPHSSHLWWKVPLSSMLLCCVPWQSVKILFFFFSLSLFCAHSWGRWNKHKPLQLVKRVKSKYRPSDHTAFRASHFQPFQNCCMAFAIWQRGLVLRGWPHLFWWLQFQHQAQSGHFSSWLIFYSA